MLIYIEIKFTKVWSSEINREYKNRIQIGIIGNMLLKQRKKSNGREIIMLQKIAKKKKNYKLPSLFVFGARCLCNGRSLG